MGESKRLVLPPKACESCGRMFARRNDESAPGFRQRKTCGRLVCLVRAGKRTRSRVAFVYYPDTYPPSFQQVRRRILTRDRDTCQWCGAIEGTAEAGRHSLNVHHINYQKDDLNEDNLITLCRRCHGWTNHNRAFWERVLMVRESGDELAA